MVKRIFRTSLILSLLFHVFTGSWLYFQAPKKDQKEKPVEIEIISAQKLQKKAQLVEQEKTVNDEVPENARFQSKFNQRVLKETKAANHGDFRNAPGAGGKKAGQKVQKVAKIKKPSLDAFKPQFDWNKVAQKEQSSDGGPGSQNDDYLKDIEKGGETVLNTREFLYYTYYNRIKRQLKQYWEPKLKSKVTKLFQRGRQIASNKDRTTRVIIVLDDKGILKNVLVVGESGIRDLDDAAVEAFRAAAPFPNPPKGIVDAEGLIKIRWDFVIESA